MNRFTKFSFCVMALVALIWSERSEIYAQNQIKTMARPAAAIRFRSILGDTYLASDSRPTALASADLNHNQWADFVYLNSTIRPPQSFSTLVIHNDLFGKTGTEDCIYDMYSYEQVALAVADLDKDGWNDLIMDYHTGLENGVQVFRNSGRSEAGCTIFESTRFHTPDEPVAIGVGDLNGDGYLDLALGLQIAHEIHFMLNKQTISELWRGFTDSIYLTWTAFPKQVIVRDFDNDPEGRADVLYMQRNLGKGAWIAWNEGISCESGFENCRWLGASKTQYSSDISPSGMVAQDLNGDNKLDFSFSYFNSPVINFIWSGNRQFRAEISPNLFGYNASTIASDDYNGDGRKDLAVLMPDDNSIRILPNNGYDSRAQRMTWSPEQKSLLPFPGDYVVPNLLLSADFNRDGRKDLLLSEGKTIFGPNYPASSVFNLLLNKSNY